MRRINANPEQKIEKEFFTGETVIVTFLPKNHAALNPELCHQKISVGTIDVGDPEKYKIVFPDNTEGYYVTTPQKGHYQLVGTYDWFEIKRANPRELREDFASALEHELALVKQLAQEPDETKRAGALATLRHLTRYLSAEINEQYKLTEQLARETDETGRAAILATLRNLNSYLTARQRDQKP